MNRFFLTACALFTTSLISISLTGCDLINPPKKEEKKTVQAEKPKEAAIPAAQNQPLPKDVLAKVGSWTLTIDQFNERLALLKQGMPDFDDKDPKAKEALLNELIRQELLVKDAQETGIGQQKDIVDAVEDFRRTMMVQELATQLTKGISVDEKEAEQYYNENKKLFVEPVEWKVREIVVADEAAAKNILVQVLQGGDFAEIAKTQSQGKTAAAGGELKSFVKAPFEAMQTAVASLDIGGVSSVFKGPDGFYIVKVDAKKGGVAKPFAQIKDELVSGLTQRKQQETILDHINKLAEKTPIDVNKELIGGPDAKQ